MMVSDCESGLLLRIYVSDVWFIVSTYVHSNNYVTVSGKRWHSAQNFN